MTIDVVKIREFTGHTQAVYAMALLQNGSVVSSGGDGMVVKWHLDMQDGILMARCNAPVYTLFAGSGFVLAGTMEGSMYVIYEDATARQIKLSDKPIFGIYAFGSEMLVLDGSGYVTVLNLQFEIQHKMRVSDNALRGFALTKKGFAVSGSDSVIRSFNPEYGLVEEISGNGQTLFTLAGNPDKELLWSGGRDARIRLYSGKDTLGEVPAHLLHIHDLQLNADATRLLSASMDKTIKLWNTDTGELLKVIDFEKHGGHRSSVNKILWFHKNTIISCSDDRTLMCFEIQEKQ